MLDALNQAPGEVGDLFRSFFGEFDFGGIELVLPTRTFDDRLEIDVAGRAVELIEVGPAHTEGDVIVHVPDASTVYTGDILFIGGTPIVWAGPLSNWVSGVRSDARDGRARPSSRVTARSPTVSGSSTSATISRSSTPRRPAGTMPESTRSTPRARSQRCSRRHRVSANSASTGGSPSTSTPCTAASIPPTTHRMSSNSSAEWPNSKHTDAARSVPNRDIDRETDAGSTSPSSATDLPARRLPDS